MFWKSGFTFKYLNMSGQHESQNTIIKQPRLGFSLFLKSNIFLQIGLHECLAFAGKKNLQCSTQVNNHDGVPEVQTEHPLYGPFKLISSIYLLAFINCGGCKSPLLYHLQQLILLFPIYGMFDSRIQLTVHFVIASHLRKKKLNVDFTVSLIGLVPF